MSHRILFAGCKKLMVLVTLTGVACMAATPVLAQEQDGASAAEVNFQRLVDADDFPGDWMTHGRTYSEQRYSPLAQIDRSTVSDLGLAWYADIDTSRAQEATPIVVDGKIYVSTSWSMVKAFD